MVQTVPLPQTPNQQVALYCPLEGPVTTAQKETVLHKNEKGECLRLMVIHCD